MRLAIYAAEEGNCSPKRECCRRGHRLAWAMQMTCKIKSSGTAKVGIKLKGSTVKASVAIPCGLISPAVVPRVAAITRSEIPSTCQRMKLLRCSGLASLFATRAAVAPIAMSPYPAGNANMPGRMP